MRDGVQEGGREPRVAACLAALKAATAAAHAQIEAVPALSALMSEGVTLHDHGAVLQRFYIHFARFEPGLFACLGRGLPRAALLRRENTGPLRADLQDLGLPIPPVVAQPGPETLAEAAGWLYVHEGSSLGGRVILRSLQARLGASLGTATRFHARHGKATAASWRETGGLIAALLPDAEALALAQAGARRAFAELHRTMATGPARGMPANRGLCPFRPASAPM